jgi:hypothetical protein
VVPDDLGDCISGVGRRGCAGAAAAKYCIYLFDTTCWPNGAGDVGDSVYGLKADLRPAVGDGMSCVTVAMLRRTGERKAARRGQAPCNYSILRRQSCCFSRLRLAVGLESGRLSEQRRGRLRVVGQADAEGAPGCESPARAARWTGQDRTGQQHNTQPQRSQRGAEGKDKTTARRTPAVSMFSVAWEELCLGPVLRNPPRWCNFCGLSLPEQQSSERLVLSSARTSMPAPMHRDPGLPLLLAGETPIMVGKSVKPQASKRRSTPCS